MKRRTIHIRRDSEISAFASRRGITYSAAVNLLLGIAIDRLVTPENEFQLSIFTTKEEIK